MFKDCSRCGFGWWEPSDRANVCVCHGLDEEQAKYLKMLHDTNDSLRRIGQRAFFEAALNGGDMTKFSTNDRRLIGIYT